MATLTPQAISRSGLTPSYSAATSGGDKVQVTGGSVFLHVKNGGGASINVTVTAQNNTYRGRTLPDNIVAVPASGERMIGPFDPQIDTDLNGQASLVYSAVTTVTVAAIRI